jgi:hypothetical protein
VATLTTALRRRTFKPLVIPPQFRTHSRGRLRGFGQQKAHFDFPRLLIEPMMLLAPLDSSSVLARRDRQDHAALLSQALRGLSGAVQRSDLNPSSRRKVTTVVHLLMRAKRSY